VRVTLAAAGFAADRALLAAVNGARLEVLRGAGRPNTLRVITRAG
jgi:hypothetical protein